MKPSFFLEANALSTPEGLAAACNRARVFVEENIPGEHQPGPRSYFNLRDGIRLVGCRCAIGYLRAAIGGDMDIVSVSLPLEVRGLPSRHRAAFEGGFDRGYGIISHVLATEKYPEWAAAGEALAHQWQQQQQQQRGAACDHQSN